MAEAAAAQAEEDRIEAARRAARDQQERAQQIVSGNQVIQARAFFARVAVAQRLEAAQTVARALIEPRQYFAELHLGVDECMKTIGTFLPPPDTPGPAPARVRQLIEAALIWYHPPGENAAQGGGAAAVAGAAQGAVHVNVDTAEARERAERWLTVGTPNGIKMPRRPEAPHSSYYPHPWIIIFADVLQTNPAGTATAARTAHEAWARQWTTVLPPTRVPELYSGAYRRQLILIEQWFAALPATATPETLSYHALRTWCAAIELLLQSYILHGVVLAGTATVATAKFWAVVDTQLHNGPGLDYLAATTAAKTEKNAGGPVRRPAGA